MSALEQQPSATRSRRHWAYGVALTAAGFLLIVLPALDTWRQARGDLERLEATYGTQVALAAQKGEIERWVREREAALAELEAKLLTAAEIAGFTQSVAEAARAAGCVLLSSQPSSPRVLARPDEKDAAKAARAKQEPRAQFVEWPMRVTVRGEYGQISALLTRLTSGARHVRLERFSLQPAGENRERLQCDLTLACYGLRTSPERE